MNLNISSLKRPVLIPESPILVVGIRRVVWLSVDGEIETYSKTEVIRQLRHVPPPIICHSSNFFAKLGAKPIPVLDILELFAFVRPAQFTLPTPRGIAEVLGIDLPNNQEQEAECLFRSVYALISELAAGKKDHEAAAIGRVMDRGGWLWAEPVLTALGNSKTDEPTTPSSALSIWDNLVKWYDGPEESPPYDFPVETKEARAQLVKLLGRESELRLEQLQYAGDVSFAFDPRNKNEEPNIVLADAGTGVGKTLGYIAPASVWAEKNDGTVWVSTFTRNLQRQLNAELDRLYPDPEEKNEKVVIRKGRENYLCLLNFSEAVGHLRTGYSKNYIGLGLMARWALKSRDGDMIGGDFPAWLISLLGKSVTLDLTDKRGECTYSSCQHYNFCFIEHSIRRARRARIVVANHALVMIQAALGGGEQGQLPTRYVFDEGHHIFDAADSAFSVNLTACEGNDLKRWLLGHASSGHSRLRGLRARTEDLIRADERARISLEKITRAARVLPDPGWQKRLEEGRPIGEMEFFLSFVRQQVFARTNSNNTNYSLESGTEILTESLVDSAINLETSLVELRMPLFSLMQSLIHILDAESDSLDTPARNRIDAVVRSIQRRGIDQIISWEAMLRALQSQKSDLFVDWFSVERHEGRELDVGMHRHHIDPTIPFSKKVLSLAHGVLITSATLKDKKNDEDKVIKDFSDCCEDAVTDDWVGARARTGTNHLETDIILSSVNSPFDYACNTKILIVNDIDKSNISQISGAYRELFLASGGGGLGLFTAISRLRDVYNLIAPELERLGMQIFSQHIEDLDVGTLIDVFRAEENACLLGTDAVRDGVDVPGRSLRLIIFDKVPWPRPNILHRARRKAFGGKSYDETLTRLKLSQAYGRLIRKTTDKGIFVMMDRALPTRLLSAFPDGVQVLRLSLKDAIKETRGFLADF